MLGCLYLLKLISNANTEFPGPVKISTNIPGVTKYDKLPVEVHNIIFIHVWYCVTPHEVNEPIHTKKTNLNMRDPLSNTQTNRTRELDWCKSGWLRSLESRREKEDKYISDMEPTSQDSRVWNSTLGYPTLSKCYLCFLALYFVNLQPSVTCQRKGKGT